ncbi:hypothetical protein ACLB2K_056263 [Fragaria x ananassa]
MRRFTRPKVIPLLAKKPPSQLPHLSPIPNPSLPQPPQNPSPPSPILTLSHTQNHTHLLTFIKTHIKNPPLTPKTLLHFLKSKLHHHPTFTHLDFHVFNWASTVDSYRHDHSTFEWMVCSLANTARFSELGCLLSFIVANPCPCSDGIFSCPRTEPIFRFAISAYCRVGRLDDAVRAFDSMRKLIDGKASVVVYNILINGFVKCGEHDKALWFYERMFGLALELFKDMRGKGCSPNVVSFNTLIKGFFREGKFEDGIEMAYEMIEFGCEFSSVTCEILVDGLCREGQVEEACELLIDFSRKGVVPRGYDYYGLVEVLCRKGNSERALEVVDELWRMRNVPSLIACTTLVEGLRRSARIDEALEVMGRMLEVDMVPDIVTFNCLLQDLCNLGRTEEADNLSLLSLTKGLELDATAYTILASGYSREGKKKEGKVVVDEMLDMGFIPDLATYNRLADG